MKGIGGRSTALLIGSGWAAVAGAWLFSRIDVPALWLDEAATSLAVERSWSQLTVLSSGPETPLLPYYVLLKALDSLTAGAGLSLSTAASLRWPSAACAALAVGCLAWWTALRLGPGIGVATGAVLALLPVWSRYGLEARPYALVLLAAIVTVVTWDVLVRGGRRRLVAAIAFAAALGALLVLSPMAAGLIPVVLVATSVLPKGRRGPALRWVITSMAVSAACVAYPLQAELTRGAGPMTVKTLTASSVLLNIFPLGAESGASTWQLASVIALCLLGLITGGLITGLRRISLLAALWALVPPLVLFVVVIWHPNLLVTRYVLYSLPGYAILGGLGVYGLGALAGRVAGLLMPGGPARALVASVGGTVVVLGVASQQVAQIRYSTGPAGHGEDIRPVLNAVAAGPPGQPIMTTGFVGPTEVLAYRPQWDARIVTARIIPTSASIWAVAESPATYAQELGRSEVAMMLIRVTSIGRCAALFPQVTMDAARQCLPGGLARAGWTVRSIPATSEQWVAIQLKRRARQPVSGLSRSTAP